jgi:plasmid stability protein
MSKMIQLRNVPDALHRALKARAARAGMSLSDYLLAEIREIGSGQRWRSCGSFCINASP